MKYKLTNTHLHIWFGMLASFIASPIILSVGIASIVTKGKICSLLFFIATILLEAWQYHRRSDKSTYIEESGFDSLIDVLSANIIFNLVMWGWIL